ncbi:MAG: cytochrome c3 family protein [Chloroflexota bacterium]
MPNSSVRFEPRRLLGLGAAIVAVLLLAAVVGLVVTQAAPEQPFAFSHTPHYNQGIPCLYCHPGADRGQAAGLPTRSKCLGCHNNLPTTGNPGRQAVIDYLNNNPEMDWAPVALAPDFVYFTHRPHLGAGLNCENCHGEVGRMMSAEPVKMSMGWCLDCHQKRAPENFVKLSDCVTCHH